MDSPGRAESTLPTALIHAPTAASYKEAELIMDRALIRRTVSLIFDDIDTALNEATTAQLHLMSSRLEMLHERLCFLDGKIEVLARDLALLD